MVRALSCAAVVIVAGLLLAAGPTPQQKYDDAAKRASHAYYVAIVAADRQLVADMRAAERDADATTVDGIRRQLRQAEAKLAALG